MTKTENLNIVEVMPITSPKQLKDLLPVSGSVIETVLNARNAINSILEGEDSRLLMIVGPCSIHDPKAAIEYAERLKKLADEVSETVLVVMRVYFEKPRTTVGWKGLINDPELDGSHKINKGIELARRLLLDINALGLPCATETLDPITPQYLADLISWSAIGARTTESQTHREMASGLSMPVGFKNGTDGGLSVAINAMKSALQPHHFLGINNEGLSSAIQTSGNSNLHLVLRGGSNGPNYDALSIQKAAESLASEGLPKAIMIDCNHANSGKDPSRQELVLRDAIHQIKNGDNSIVGIMIESNINGGNQPISASLQYGVSITDACLDWENTNRIILNAHQSLITFS
ncbi:MAG: phospho-2-dehydro-3-deoxyheptonate aldolase [Pseudomonadota bacterium]|nr:MAG: phospho-2-dehydro-3-deoxyheptonate aldolase [Pseudomonadota bacterium]